MPNKNKEYVNGTFSGSDIVAMIVFPNSKPIVIGELSTATYSVYREKNPVRTLSRINVNGFTKGPRTVAGTLIFTVFEKHILNRIRQEVPYLKNMTALKVDELPPFDLYLTMGNEYGSSSRLNIYGLTIVDEGKVFSVEDMFTENQWSYMARDIVLMDDLGAEQNTPITQWESGEATGAFTSNDLVLDDKYKAMLDEIARLKADRDKAVEEARKKALEKYTATYDDFEYEDTFIPVKSTEIILDPGVDPEVLKKPKLDIKVKYNTVLPPTWSDKPSTPTGRSFVVKIDIKDGTLNTLYDGKTVVVEASLDGWHQSWNVAIKNAHAIIEVINFKAWTPKTPNLRVYIPTQNSKFTKSSGTSAMGVINYELLGKDSLPIVNDGDQVFTFVFGKSNGATKDKENTVTNGLALKLGITSGGTGSSTGSSETYCTMYRDAIFDLAGGITTGTPKYSYDPADGDWYTQSWMVPGTVWGKYGGKPLDNKKCLSYFNFKITGATKNGAPYTLTKTDLGNITIRADVKVTVTVKSTGKTYTVDGSNENGNIANIENSAWDMVHKGLDFGTSATKSMNTSNGYKIYPLTDTPMGNVVDHITSSIKSKGSSTAKQQHATIWWTNIRAIYKPTGKEIPLTHTPSTVKIYVKAIHEGNVRQLLWK